MSCKSNRWGLCPWFEERGADLIHPDDFTAVQRLTPYGKVFRMLGERDGFVRLSYGEAEFRVRPSLFQQISAEVHAIGETVVLEDGRTGEVIGVEWHHQRGEPMYQLRLEGKTRSKRYWNSDFNKSRIHGPDPGSLG